MKGIIHLVIGLVGKLVIEELADPWLSALRHRYSNGVNHAFDSAQCKLRTQRKT